MTITNKLKVDFQWVLVILGIIKKIPYNIVLFDHSDEKIGLKNNDASNQCIRFTLLTVVSVLLLGNINNQVNKCFKCMRQKKCEHQKEGVPNNGFNYWVKIWLSGVVARKKKKKA